MLQLVELCHVSYKSEKEFIVLHRNNPLNKLVSALTHSVDFLYRSFTFVLLTQVDTIFYCTEAQYNTGGSYPAELHKELYFIR
jgi:hypothetical protein